MIQAMSYRSVPEPPGPSADHYFSFIRADRPEDLEATYRIRYQVYCVERGFFHRDAYPLETEQDEFDGQAVHILASHTNGLPAGTARLVIHSRLGFPLARHCEFAPGHRFLEDCSAQAKTLAGYAEISRLAISKVYRRREGDTLYGGPPRQLSSETKDVEVIPFPTTLRDTPEIVSGMFRLLYQESKRRGIDYWVAAMERGLHVILSRMGLRFKPIGPKIDYLGPVRPYEADIKALERHLYRTAPAVFDYMTNGLEPEFMPTCIQDSDISWEDDASVA